jgi:hypothetical protein
MNSTAAVLTPSPTQIELDNLLGEGYICVYEIRGDGDGEQMLIASDSFVEDNPDIFLNYIADKDNFFLVNGSESGDFPSIYELTQS